ncbi:HDOD domain-containing protein [Thiohalobacter sp. IOR34]|uniref:HDOD domain-containing protein n=1 Tax=Thiohalobacter sp. IOR34 TaxID=3057176 RepID=UPI0025B0FB13|nr:HDOD domain-containing protein [Thiohalobacter sp. IOR34]WJW75080.1 HDOD domain-containing protein [Thiohalobacter sp. IOR34]
MDTDAQHRLQEILHLPPLPGVACELLQVLGEEEIDIDRLGRLIEQDPGLAARIIGIANSAYFARPHPVCSVTEAIVRVLGLNLVRALAIGIALSKPFDVGACPSFEFEGYWYRAFVTATLAGRLAPELALDEVQRDCLFLAGLLHNLGQLVLVHAFPGRMADVFQRLHEHPEQDLLNLETELLAVDEAEAGAVIARSWHLPACVGDCIRFCHDPHHASRNQAMVQVVAYCSGLASALYADPGVEPPPLGAAGPAATGIAESRIQALIEWLRASDERTRALAATLASPNGDCHG